MFGRSSSRNDRPGRLSPPRKDGLVGRQVLPASKGPSRRDVRDAKRSVRGGKSRGWF
jgi:hypothetical protein